MKKANYKRNKPTHGNEEKQQKPFFAKANDTAVQTKAQQPFFQPKLAIGKPGDKYEKEADNVADAVVNNSRSTAPAIQQKEISSIQRSTLASPEKDEKFSTAEQRVEEDKMIQSKEEEEPIQAKEEEEMPVQKMEEEEPIQAKEEEEMPVQKMEEEEPIQAKEEEEMPVQKMEEEEPIQAKEEEEMPVQKMEEEPLQAKEEEEMPIQKMEEEEPMQAKEEEEAPIQTKAANTSNTASPNLTQKIKQKSGKGSPLPDKIRAEMESTIGADFSDVNIHTDSDAQDMNKELHAQAFTHGKDVYFNTGKYNPETTEGKQLLAHELTHVVQQNEKG